MLEISQIRSGGKVYDINDPDAQPKLTVEVLDNGNIRIGNLEGGAKEFISGEMLSSLATKDSVEGISERVTDLENAETNIDDINHALAKQAEELNTKAPKVGYAPDLKVDFAKELVGRGVAEPQEIGTIRPTGLISIGDGNATIEKVKGNSVVWNQQIKPIAPYTTNGVTFTMQDDGTVTMSGVSTATALLRVMGHEEFISGHTYVITGGFEESSFESYMLSVNVGGIYKYIAAPNVLFKADPDVTLDLYVRIAIGIDTNNLSVKPKSHDLTKMFGAGKEPTTIEEFEARKTLGVTNEYNEGTIISYDGDALKSVGFNAWDEEWEVGAYSNSHGGKTNSATNMRNTNPIKVCGGVEYYIKTNATTKRVYYYNANGEYLSYKTISYSNTFTPPSDCAFINFYTSDTTYNHDICIHLVHTGYRNGEYAPYEADIHLLPDVKTIKDKDGNTLFPYGLLSAGSVFDEITETKAIKRIGVVDMGDLSWQRSSSGDFRADLLTAALPLNAYSLPNVTSAMYTREVGNKIAFDYDNTPDKAIAIYTTRKLFVKDTRYTDSATFKEAVQGVMLYYELAEPIEVDLPEPLNLTYDAWDFGTEELIAEGKTTPLNADIVYQFNAVDRIRENAAKNQALEAELAELKAQLTQLTQVTSDENSNA